ncbi:MAG: peptidase S24 [Gammaproteobacteria bacterium HGW-Gammaproteobacteria-11]|nr:MAG: peptidase S24 [Gammaproteobacteria bacterium HGW-Gammaproteobacteria-11]
MSNAVFIGTVTPSGTLISCFDTRVPAGFPSPALDHMEQKISLDTLLDVHAPHTYLVRVSGESMTGAGIHDGDILVVSRAANAKHRDIVVAAVNGEVLVKRLIRRGKQIILQPENPAFSPLHILEGDELQIWGVVRNSIRWHDTGEK